MKSILTSITDFFCPDSINYAHRDRTIEVVAMEKNIAIDSIKNDTKVILNKEGRVAAITDLRNRFHIPLASAWRFVDKLDKS